MFCEGSDHLRVIRRVVGLGGQNLGFEPHCTSARIRGRRPWPKATVLAHPCLAPLGTHDARPALSPVSGRLFRVWPGSVRRPWCAAPAEHGRLRTQEERVPCRAPLAPPASDPIPRSAPIPIRPAPPVERASKPPPRLVHARPVSPTVVPASPTRLAVLASAAATTWIPQRRSPSMNPSDLRLPRFRDVSDQEPLGMDLPPSLLAA